MGLRIPEKLRVGNPVDFARLVWDEVSTVHVMVPGTKCSVKVRVCAHGPLLALPPSCSRTGKGGGRKWQQGRTSPRLARALSRGRAAVGSAAWQSVRKCSWRYLLQQLGCDEGESRFLKEGQRTRSGTCQRECDIGSSTFSKNSLGFRGLGQFVCFECVSFLHKQ